MVNPNFNSTTTTGLTAAVPNYAVAAKTTDGDFSQDENRWTNTKANDYYGFYANTGEYSSALNSFATWVIGQGYEADPMDKVMLELINGWGEDTFLSILWNMLVVKKMQGDSYAEIIRAESTKLFPKGRLINLKILNSARMAHITNKKGLLIRYEYTQADGKIQTFKPDEVLHFCNDRILDEPHGTAVTKSVEWVINKIKQAREDYARLLHVTSIRVLYVDEEDTARQNKIKAEYAEAIKKGEVMMITCRPEDAKFQDLTVPPIDAWIRWLTYLEDHFYKALGVPKVVLGGTAENTEASAKVAVIVYEPVWTREISELEADLWSQLGIRIKVNKQPSLMENMQSDEAKNTGQVGFQKNDVAYGGEE